MSLKKIVSVSVVIPRVQVRTRSMPGVVADAVTSEVCQQRAILGLADRHEKNFIVSPAHSLPIAHCP